MKPAPQPLDRASMGLAAGIAAASCLALPLAPELASGAAFTILAIAAGAASWAVWGPRHPWLASLLVAVGPSALSVPWALALLAAAALACAAWRPHWAHWASPAPWILLAPLPAGLAAAGTLAMAAALGDLAWRRPRPPRAGTLRTGLQAGFAACAAALLAATFVVGKTDRLEGLWGGLAAVALVALAGCSAIAILLAWRTGQGRRMALGLTTLAAAVLVAAFVVAGLPLAGPVAFLVAFASIHVPPIAALAVRSLAPASAGLVSGGLTLAGAVALRGLAGA